MSPKFQLGDLVASSAKKDATLGMIMGIDHFYLEGYYIEWYDGEESQMLVFKKDVERLVENYAELKKTIR